MRHKYPKDLSGYRFGKLTALKLSKNKTSSGKSKWICICDCGRMKEVSRANLIQGYVQSCGCLKKELDTRFSQLEKSVIDMTGVISNKLTVVAMKENAHPPVCICKCECGNICEVDAREIRNGRRKSCGCLRYKLRNSLIGRKFGQLEVIERVPNYVSPTGLNQTKYRCLCSCGRTTEVTASSLKRGLVTSCGHILSCTEETVADYLNNRNIKFIRQYRIDACKDKRPLPFDFAIFSPFGKLLFLLEIDGIHHFEQRFSKDLSYTQMHDQIKYNYCQKNKIKLIRIPYWDFNDVEDKLEVIIENDYKPFVVS